MKRANKKTFLPVIFVFILLNSVIIIFKTFLTNNGVDCDFLIVANLLLFVLSMVGFYLQQKGIQSDNANAFVHSVYSSMLIKLFVCMIAVLVHVFIKTSGVNKPALFTSMGIYALYTAFEVAGLMRVARERKNV